MNLSEIFKFPYDTWDFLKKGCFTPGIQISLSFHEMKLLTQH